MMEQHKQTPWMIGAFETGMAAIDSSDDQEVTGFIDPEDARRILACVNACAGIPTDDLELCPEGGLLHLAAHADQLVKQRDELLSALIGLHDAMACYDKTPEETLALAAAETAIASVKGGAK